jgi:hypothetical protein
MTAMKNILAFYLIAIFIFSCEEDKNQVELFRVKENKISCQGVGPMECYLVQKGDKIGTEEWEYFYDEIEGFNYEPGFVYTLSVDKEPIPDPPMDSSSIRYILREVLSKEPK